MTQRDDDFFRPKVGPPKARGDARARRFVNRVVKASSKAGGKHAKRSKAKRARPGAKLGRGYVAAKLAGQSLHPRSRRVIIKAGLIRLKRAGRRSTVTHLRYIERDGATRAGEKAHLYGPDADVADGQAFESRGRDDRHQFRFIVSPEDGAELDDLKTFTRQLMAQMERDLGTKLDWVAADHWNTDQPHTHIVLRGKDDTGHDLIIAPEYIAHGMRHRAAELATEWLGLRTEREIQESLSREVEQERWTSLDRAIQQQAVDGVIDLRDLPDSGDARRHRALLIGRLNHLSQMGLAHETPRGVWSLKPDIERTLRTMSERGDIVRTMQRAFTEQREYSIFSTDGPTAPITGRIAAKGLADELHDRGYLIIDGTDGRAHYVTLSSSIDISDVPIGAVVTARSGVEPRTADRTVASIAQEGVYSAARHLELAQRTAGRGYDTQEYVRTHVRRLEALRRAGIVERIEEGVWRIPNDLVARGQTYDAQHTDGARIDMRSYLPIEQQKRAIGATWLDRQLLSGRDSLSTTAFGAAAREALAEREGFLIEQGLAERRGQRVILARNLLATLRDRELESAAKAIETETGLTHRPITDGQNVSGIYRRSITLASGRFAMLDSGMGFALVPWRPVIEQRLGQSVAATVNGDYVSWELGRQRGLSR